MSRSLLRVILIGACCTKGERESEQRRSWIIGKTMEKRGKEEKSAIKSCDICEVHNEWKNDYCLLLFHCFVARLVLAKSLFFARFFNEPGDNGNAGKFVLPRYCLCL